MSHLSEQWGRLDIAPTGRVVLVLDASESATEGATSVRPQIYKLVQEVLAQLPEGTGAALYFLGNPRPYPAVQLARSGTKWFDENRMRTSLITPIFEQLDISTNLAIVIIGSGTIFDLEDWAETPFEASTTLVSLGKPLLEPPGRFSTLTSPEAATIVQRLHDPVVGVDIHGAGFLPTWWNNPGYRLTFNGRRACLAAGRLESYGLTVRFFAASEETLTATLHHDSGHQEAVDVRNTSGLLTTPTMGFLMPAEVEALTQALRHEAFTCPRCGRTHPWNTLTCRDGGFGRSIYPSLPSSAGFVQIWFAGQTARFVVLTGDVLCLETGLAAIREGRRAVLARYDAGGECWTKTADVLQPYHRLEDESYALLI